MSSHTDKAGHTKALGDPVTQTGLGIPRPLVTQSHRHGWTYQGLWLPSHTDTAGHTKAFDYPVTQTRLDIPKPLVTQSHRHGWAYQGLWLPSHTDRAGHTKAFDYPVTQTRLDIPRPLITQSWTTGRKCHGPLEETGVPGRNHRPTASTWKNLHPYGPWPVPVTDWRQGCSDVRSENRKEDTSKLRTRKRSNCGKTCRSASDKNTRAAFQLIALDDCHVSVLRSTPNGCKFSNFAK